jgi:hypothetical protein
MRSAIQANRGQASILQGLPPETPETPVLIFQNFFIFSHFAFGRTFSIIPALCMMRLFLTSHLHIAGKWASGQGIIKHSLDDQSYSSDRREPGIRSGNRKAYSG